MLDSLIVDESHSPKGSTFRIQVRQDSFVDLGVNHWDFSFEMPVMKGYSDWLKVCPHNTSMEDALELITSRELSTRDKFLSQLLLDCWTITKFLNMLGD